jgi:hypothetical protein
MAEDEIAKHSRKIYKTWFNKELSIWHKISEFLIEMTIIVFAVSISIWFHNVSEHKHQQEDVKQFLTGNTKRLTDSTDNMIDVIKTDESFNLCRSLGNPAQVLERYDQCIQLMEKIITQIDREYY